MHEKSSMSQVNACVRVCVRVCVCGGRKEGVVGGNSTTFILHRGRCGPTSTPTDIHPAAVERASTCAQVPNGHPSYLSIHRPFRTRARQRRRRPTETKRGHRAIASQLARFAILLLVQAACTARQYHRQYNLMQTTYVLIEATRRQEVSAEETTESKHSSSSRRVRCHKHVSPALLATQGRPSARHRRGESQGRTPSPHAAMHMMNV